MEYIFENSFSTNYQTLAGITMDIQNMPVQKQTYHHHPPPTSNNQFMNNDSPTKDFWFGTPKVVEQKPYGVDPDRWYVIYYYLNKSS